jgi:hypothetical protein
MAKETLEKEGNGELELVYVNMPQNDKQQIEQSSGNMKAIPLKVWRTVFKRMQSKMHLAPEQ